MYKPGDATLRINLGALDEDQNDAHYDGCYEQDDHVSVESKIRYMAALPHSCDEWVIGGAAEIRSLIEDLQKILEEAERIEANTK